MCSREIFSLCLKAYLASSSGKHQIEDDAGEVEAWDALEALGHLQPLEALEALEAWDSLEPWSTWRRPGTRGGGAFEEALEIVLKAKGGTRLTVERPGQGVDSCRQAGPPGQGRENQVPERNLSLLLAHLGV